MAYENRWNERDDRYGRSRDEGWDRDDRSRGENDRSWRSEAPDQNDRARTWAPFGNDGPSNYDRQGVRADDDRAGYRSGYPDRSGPSRSAPTRGAQTRGAWVSDDDYGRGRDRDVGQGYRSDRDAGFSETGGRYSDSYREGGSGGQSSGRQEPWTSRSRSGSEPEGRNFLDKAADTVSSWFGEVGGRGGQDGRGGEHRGRGPKGYRRSDERIRDDVSDRLSDDSWLDASDIEVRVENSEVTLDGTVSSRDDKRRAEDLADRVSGVEHVQNNLRVKRAGDALATTAAATMGGATSSLGAPGGDFSGGGTASGRG